MVVGSLQIQMYADVARIADDMRKVQDTVGGAMAKVESAVAFATRAFGALGVSVSAVAFVRMVDGAIEAMGAMHELAQRTGVTVETLSALELVAKQSGTNMDEVAKVVQKLSKNLLEFSRDGSSKVGEAFKLIGITQKQAAEGLENMDKFLPEFAKKLLESASGGRQVALAQELMSKSGANLLPFLHQLAETGKLNAKYTAEQARAADDFKDAQARLKDQSSLLGIALANDVLPSLNNIATAMIKAREEGEGFWGAMYRGMQVFLTGTDLHKANVDFAKKTQELMAHESALSQLSSSVAPGVAQRHRENIERLKNELKALQVFRDQLEAEAKKPPPATGAGGGGGGGRIVDEGALKKHLEMLERYRKMDAASWVKHIDEEEAAYERELHAMAKLTEAFYKEKEKLDKADQASVFAIIDAEQDHLIALGAALVTEMSENHKELEKLSEEAKKQAEELARAQLQYQTDFWRDVDRVAHDTFASIFDSGKDTFTRLTETLKNTLYSLLYKMAVQPFLIQVVTSTAGSQVAQSVFGAAAMNGQGGMGGIGNLLSTGQSIYGAMTGNNPVINGITSLFGGGAGVATAGGVGLASSPALAGMLAPSLTVGGLGAAGAVGALGGGLGLTAGGTGLGLAASSGALIAPSLSAGAAGAAIAGTGAASAGAAAGAAGAASAIGAAVPIIGAVIAIAALAGAFGKKKEPPILNVADLAMRFGATGDELWRGSSLGDLSPAAMGHTGGGAEGILRGLNTRYRGFSQALGIVPDEVLFAYGADAKAGKMNNFSLQSAVRGQQFLSGDVGYSEEAFKDVSSRAVLSAVLANEMPAYLKKAFEQYAPDSSTETINSLNSAQIDSALQFVGTLKEIRDTLTKTPLERANEQMKLFNDMLGQNATTAEKYKSVLLEQIDAGKVTADSLPIWQGLGTAIDQVAQLTAQAAEAANAAAEAEKQLAAERHAARLAVMQEHIGSLEGQLRTAYESEVRMQEQRVAAVKSAEDQLRQAYESQASTLEALSQKWMDTAKNLQAYLDQLQGTTGTPNQNYAAFSRQFAEVRRRMGLGDSEAFDQFEGAAESFRGASLARAGSRFDYMRDVGQIQAAAANGITTATRQAAAADRQLEALRRQVEELIDIDSGVMSVDRAIGNLQTAQQAAAQGAEQLAVYREQVSQLITLNDTALTIAQLIAQLGAARSNVLNANTGLSLTNPQGFGFNKWMSTVGGGQAFVSPGGAYATLDASGQQIIHSRTGASFSAAQAYQDVQNSLGSPLAIYNAAQQHGISLSTLDILMGWAPGTASDVATNVLGLPGFAVGTPSVPHDMLAMVHKGERIIPAASNDELIDEVRGLREEMRWVKAAAVKTAQNTGDFADLSKKWDNIGIPTTEAVAA